MTHVLVQDCNKANIKKKPSWRNINTKCVMGFTANCCQSPVPKNIPENPPFKDRYARVYCGLSTEEALWLVSRQNIRAVMHHVISS